MTLKECWECGEGISTAAETCPNCGAPARSGLADHSSGRCRHCGDAIEILSGSPCPECGTEAPLSGHWSKSSKPAARRTELQSEKSDGLAALLGFFLGPVGLWYKGQWAAGFAWVFGAFVLAAASSGLLAPVAWIGMAMHAYQADPAT